MAGAMTLTLGSTALRTSYIALVRPAICCTVPVQNVVMLASFQTW